MRKSFFPVAFILSLVVSVLVNVSGAGAITGWNAGYIINDSTFTANTSMSASSIQSFLNAKVPTCDTNGQQLSEFGGPDLNGDGKVQRWEWGKANYNQTTFTCLKDWKDSNGVSAARVIYNKAQTYKISPKVLLVLLQKEQSLVTDTWPLNVQYRTATGYGCPDTSGCDATYYGFTNQVDWAAKMFRAIMDDSPTWYTPYNLGVNYIQYNPSSSCGGSNVNIINRATQALYNYTPYQPNKAALDAGWGTAPCGAYGNRNFFLYFTNWFGQPNTGATYGYSLVSQELYSDSAYTNKVATNSAVMNSGSVLYAKVVVKNTGNQVWYNDFLRAGTTNAQDRSSAFSDASWIAPNRPVQMMESSVAPGQTATLEFKLSAPTTPYTEYSESFGILLEHQRWLPGAFTYNLTVEDPTPIYSVQNVDTIVTPGQSGIFRQDPNNIQSWDSDKFYVTVKIKNTGNRVLPANLTKVATSSPQDRASIFQDSSWLSASRVTAAKEGNIKPGDTGTFSFTMTTPTGQSGLKDELFGVVIEGQQWVAQDIIDLKISIGTKPPSALNAPGMLSQGEYLMSPNEKFRLVLQGDGNLVLYSVTTGRPLWNTRTSHTAASKLYMQSDGSLVLYQFNPTKALWNTRTYRTAASKLYLQDDGNLVLYTSSNKPAWDTHTNGSL